MELVNDVNQYIKIYEQFKTDKKNILTNNYLLLENINSYLINQQMYFCKISNGIAFICEEEDFFYLYYYLDTNSINKQQNLTLKLSKPIIINLVFTKNTDISQANLIENYWAGYGFSLYKINQRMRCNQLNMGNIMSISSYDEIMFDVEYAQEEHADQLIFLWREVFDPLNTELPDKTEIIYQIKQRNILCIIDESRKLVAAIQFLPKGNYYVWQHIAVDPAYRRRGLSYHIVKKWVLDHPEVRKHLLWVDLENKPAISLYEKLGFSPDGKINYKLIKKETICKENSNRYLKKLDQI